MESIFDPDLFISRDYQTLTFTYKDISQSLYSLKSSSTDFDLTGQIIWPAAEYLSQYIIDNSSIFQDKDILELGSGAGLSGLVASIYAKNVVLTDGNDIVCELMEKNKPFAKKNNVMGKKLWWGRENTLDLIKTIEGIDVVIGADILFWPECINPLVETIKAIKEKFPKCLFLISICFRAKYSEDTFNGSLKNAGLKREVVISQGNIFLYKIEEIEGE